MPPILSNDRLIRVGKATKNLVTNWKEAESLCRDSGSTIDHLVKIVAVDRWKLAFEHRRQANKLLSIHSSHYRSAVSRYYYAMYHSIRACAFIFHGGDDHEKHSDLPDFIPTDFDPLTNWKNKLKDARAKRNSADYDPYPKSDLAWKADALNLKRDVDLLIQKTKEYLAGKGCML